MLNADKTDPQKKNVDKKDLLKLKIGYICIKIKLQGQIRNISIQSLWQAKATNETKPGLIDSPKELWGGGQIRIKPNLEPTGTNESGLSDKTQTEIVTLISEKP